MMDKYPCAQTERIIGRIVEPKVILVRRVGMALNRPATDVGRPAVGEQTLFVYRGGQ